MVPPPDHFGSPWIAAGVLGWDRHDGHGMEDLGVRHRPRSQVAERVVRRRSHRDDRDAGVV
jgi:hypothetical protein